MSERKVSLRVSAVGGEKLKAELRSIGKEGHHALTLIEGGGPGASRGLSATSAAADELMGRLTRLSAQAAQAAANMNTVGGSGASVLERVNNATGVSGRVSRDAEDIDAYGRALDEIRAKMNPLFAEMQRHRGAIGDIDQAWRVGAITLDEWVSATRREEAANKDAAVAIRLRQAAFENFVNTGLRDAINEITGVTGVLARSVEDMDAFGRAMDDARAKFAPLYAQTRQHGEAMQEMQRLYRAGILTEDEYTAAVKREAAAHGQAMGAIRARQAALANLIDTSLRDKINSNMGIGGDAARSAEDIAAYGRALDETRAKYNPMYAAISKYRAELAAVKAAHAAGSISADEMTAAISRLRQASLRDIGIIKGRVQGYQAMEKGAGMARFQMVQLGYQLNDIGVSLAGGQNPLLVLVQQGAQIQQIYGNGQGGVQGMFRHIGQMVTGLVTKFWPLVAVAALFGGAVAGMTSEINKTSKVTVKFQDTALAVFQVVGAGIWKFIKPAVDAIAPWFQTAWDAVSAGVKWLGNVQVNTFRTIVEAVKMVPQVASAEFTRIMEIGRAAYDGITAIWGALPSAIGDFVFGAADSMVKGIETMLNAAVDRINSFIDKINGVLAGMPEWAKDRLGGGQIGRLDSVNLPGVTNPYRGGVAAAQAAYDKAAAAIAGAATADNKAWSDFKGRAGEIWDSDPMSEFFDAVSEQAKKNALAREAKENKNKGGGKSEKDEVEELIAALQREMMVLRETDPIKQKMLEYSKQLAGATDEQRRQVEALVVALDKERNGWAAIPRALKTYAEEAKRFGDDIGAALVNAFDSATDALVDFIKTGKFSFSDLATSIIADLARIAIKSFIMGPIAGALGNMLPGKIGAAFTKAFVQHTGGAAGSGPMREVSAANFVNAPRLHNGMGDLRADEFAAVLQRGERVLNRRETKEYEAGRFGGSAPIINFNGVRDVQSFRQSRTQIAADLSRAISMAKRA
ncbi:MAG TPA: phage tail tape measure C-terminal domain-containing protein [Novosphingobium sp.]|jgi:hypothetical protein|nr:phage tail tape measure C-terminal domain-containing protein [Novosphingobium sp.]